MRSSWVGCTLLRACCDDSGIGRLCDSCKSCARVPRRSLCNGAANDNTNNDGDDYKEHNRSNCRSHNNPNNIIGWREKYENPILLSRVLITELYIKPQLFAGFINKLIHEQQNIVLFLVYYICCTILKCSTEYAL